jgi:A/G-specific adenine glycosylase
MVPVSDSFDYRRIGREMLAWYDRHARSLPWRVAPAGKAAGILPDPYHVWLSEVMLQQTQVTTVAGYFTRFLILWPDIGALANAQDDAVMAAWAGLGYYSRARNLKKCAQTIAKDHHGIFPRRPDELRQLPGIGAYTANAIAAIAFDMPVAAIDGNVERVAARLFALEQPIARIKDQIAGEIGKMVPHVRPGDFAQAMMDLGATICTAKAPACAICPLQPDCRASHNGNPQAYPVRTPKRPKPLRRGAAYVARRADGAILLRKRAETGMLGGMAEVPSSCWGVKGDGATDISGAPFAAHWRLAGTIRHTFTHFDLELTVWRADLDSAPRKGQGKWVDFALLGEQALPTVMKKAIAAACPDAFLRQGAA